MYPGTIVEYVDESYISPIVIENPVRRPLLFALFTADRGPEDLRRVSGKDFFDLYGNISFEKHGQPLLQAAMSINWGAELYCKRIVDNNAKLGHNAIYAKVIKTIKDNSPVVEVRYYNYNSMTESTNEKTITDAENLFDLCAGYCKKLFGTQRKIPTAPEGVQAYIVVSGEEPVKAGEIVGLTDRDGLLIHPIEVERDATYSGYYHYPSEVNNDGLIKINGNYYFYNSANDTEKIYIKAENVNTNSGGYVAKAKYSEIYLDPALKNPLDHEIKNASGDSITKSLALIADQPISYDQMREQWYFEVEERIDSATEVNRYYVKEYDEENKLLFEDNYLVHYYPLFAVVDNGRCLSTKSYTITPNYDISKNASYMMYDINVYDGSKVIETIHFNHNHNIATPTTSLEFTDVTRNAIQFSGYQDPEQVARYINLIAELNEVSVNDVKGSDILFGNDSRRKAKVSYITNIYSDPTDKDLIDIKSNTNLHFVNGGNGRLGSRPVKSAIYEDAMCSVFTDKITDDDGGELIEKYADIWNLDRNMIVAVIDANYPVKLKEYLTTWVNKRQDCVFLRDMGNGTPIATPTAIDDTKTITLNTLTAIETYYKTIKDSENNLISENPDIQFVSLYCNSYDIYDPYTARQIPVSIGYSLARLFIQHFNNGLSLVFAGQKNGITIPEAIPGTINFIPVSTPTAGNQKEDMEDMRINYANYYNDLLVVETEYTAYNIFSQFTFLNNILAIQEAVRAVRTRCPAIRYTFVNGSDFEYYKNEVNKVLSNYTSNFLNLSLEYIGDDTYIQNKIFYAAIRAKFKDFIQTEWFKVIAINSAS